MHVHSWFVLALPCGEFPRKFRTLCVEGSTVRLWYAQIHRRCRLASTIIEMTAHTQTNTHCCTRTKRENVGIRQFYIALRLECFSVNGRSFLHSFPCFGANYELCVQGQASTGLANTLLVPILSGLVNWYRTYIACHRKLAVVVPRAHLTPTALFTSPPISVISISTLTPFFADIVSPRIVFFCCSQRFSLACFPARPRPPPQAATRKPLFLLLPRSLCTHWRLSSRPWPASSGCPCTSSGLTLWSFCSSWEGSGETEERRDGDGLRLCCCGRRVMMVVSRLSRARLCQPRR